MKLRLTIFILFFCGLFLFSNNVSAQCVGSVDMPYRPDFGTIGDTNRNGFTITNKTGGSSDAVNWNFRSTSYTENRIVPDFIDHSSNATAGNLWTRCLSLTANKKYRLTFDAVSLVPNMTSYLFIYIAKGSASAAGARIITLAPVLPGTNSYNVLIDSIDATVNYYIAFRVENIASNKGEFYLDNIVFKELPEVDYALYDFVTPVSNCVIDDQPVRIQLRNNGIQKITEVMAYYQIDDNAPVGELISTDISTDEIKTIQFQNLPVFAAGKTSFTMRAWLQKTGNDVDLSNDTLKNHIVKHTELSTIPYQTYFSESDIANSWIVRKRTPSASSWTFANSGLTTYAQIPTTGDSTNDWLISNCIRFEQGKTYQIKFSYRAVSYTKRENLEFKIGRSQLNLDNLLFALNNFHDTIIKTVTTYYTATETGSHFVGFHAISPKLRSGIVLTNLNIIEYTPAEIPVYYGFESLKNKNDWSFVDAASSDTSWKIVGGVNDIFKDDSAAKVISTRSQGGCDWIISRPLHLQIGHTYKFSYAAKSQSANGELMKIFLGQSPSFVSLQTSRVLSEDSVKSTTYEMRSFTFQPSTTDIYYIGLLFASNAHGNGGLYLDEIALIENTYANVPDFEIIGVKLTKSDNPNVSISSGCNLGNNNTLHVRVKTHVTQTINNIDVYYQINSETPVKQQISVDNLESKWLKFDNVNLSETRNYEIRAWVAYPTDYNHRNDTSDVLKISNVRAIDLAPIYRFGFEDNESFDAWNLGRWNVVHNPLLSFRGNAHAYSAGSIQAKNAWMFTRCIEIHKDTTYMVSFYYRSVDTSRAENLGVGYNSNQDGNSINQIGKINNFKTISYKRAVNYFRVPSTRPYYIGFQDSSKNPTHGILFDELLITDSITGNRPELQFVSANAPSSIACKYGEESLSITFANNGIRTLSGFELGYKTGDGSIVKETYTDNIEPDAVKTYTFNAKWDLTNIRKDSIRFWVSADDELDRTNDSSSYYRIERVYDDPVPYTCGFEQTDDLNGWAIINADKDAYLWGYASGSGARTGSGYATMTTSLDVAKNNDWLVSKCIYLEAAKPYKLRFHYKGYGATAAEKMNVYIANQNDLTTLENGTKLIGFEAFSNTQYQLAEASFGVSVSGSYYIGFHALGSASARQIFIDDFAVIIDTASLPIDVKITEISSPASDTNLTETEMLIVKIKNESTKRVTNIPVHVICKFINTDGSERLVADVTETVSSLNAGDSYLHTFSNFLNMQDTGKYVFTAIANHSDDKNAENDTCRKTVYCYAPAPVVGIRKGQNETDVKIVPNPATSSVSVQSPLIMRSLNIYNAVGKEVFTTDIQKNQIDIRVDQYVEGVYFVKVVTSQGAIVKKLIIKR